MLIGGSMMGALAKTASSFKPDKEALEREKNKPGYTKPSSTVEFGGVKLPDNEQNKKIIAVLQASQQQEIFPGAEQPGLQRRGTLKRPSKTNVKQGVDMLENMDLRSRFEPKDGVNFYEWSGGYEREKGDRGRKEGSGLKYQLLKKGKPYTRLGKDNKSLRLTREKYFEVADK